MPKQIIQGVAEGLKDQIKDLGQAAVRAPLNIVKEILAGGSGASGNKAGAPKAVTPRQAKYQQLLQTEEVERQQQLVAVRRQIQYLRQQEADYRRRKQEAETAEAKVGEEDRVEEQKEAVDEQKATEKQKTLQQTRLRGTQGTRESGPRRAY